MLPVSKALHRVAGQLPPQLRRESVKSTQMQGPPVVQFMHCLPLVLMQPVLPQLPRSLPLLLRPLLSPLL